MTSDATITGLTLRGLCLSSLPVHVQFIEEFRYGQVLDTGLIRANIVCENVIQPILKIQPLLILLMTFHSNKTYFDHDLSRMIFFVYFFNSMYKSSV